MTNEELALAINRAHEIMRATMPQSPVFQDICGHFKALIEVQRARAKSQPTECADPTYKRTGTWN